MIINKIRLTQFLKVITILLIVFSVLSCSGNESNVEEEDTLETEISSEETNDDAGDNDVNTSTTVETGTDTTTTVEASFFIDFGEFKVETSWISGDKSDRDEFVASTIDGEEWMDVEDSGIVVMKCLALDGHRTEIKEKTGVEDSLDTYKKMNYTATLNNIPENGVTVAQIHNRGGVNRPWIRVYIDDDKYLKIKATETTPDEDSSTYTTYTGPLYTAGSEFSIGITTQNGEATFEIITNDITYTEIITPSNDWSNYADSYYFKAGVYTEGDDVQPEMRMSAFSIEY